MNKYVLKHKKSGDEVEVERISHGERASVRLFVGINVVLHAAHYEVLGFELVEKREPLVWEGEVRGERWSSCGDWVSFISTCNDLKMMGKRFKAKLVEIVEE